jgi:nucleoid-associated protein YgaU
MYDKMNSRMERPAQEPKKHISDFRTQRDSADAPEVIAEHTVGGGDTLSHIALEYYGSATKPYWMVIYEANKALIGDDPNRLKRGITLKIPALPPELKK